ncbi:MAG: RnfABCDGE type electron transport complex subunit D [Clostridia bacterium]|nr:RnfABCDGE type electron transport complex subunit D [Clostridia bacterium]
MNQRLNLSAGPHVRDRWTTPFIMMIVLIALTPAAVIGVVVHWVKFQSLNALWIILASVGSAMLTELLFCLATRRKITIWDGSAAVTGLLLALCLSPQTPVVLPIVGSVFAILVVKCCFGGLGKNFINPALAARCFLLLSFSNGMTNYPGVNELGVDALSSATPVAMLKAGSMVNVTKMFLGTAGGVIGSSILALLVGGLVLWGLDVIHGEICFSVVGGFSLCLLLYRLFGGHGFDIGYVAAQLCSGGVIMGAFFMATDYTTSPVSRLGQFVYGCLIGVLGALFRILGKSADSFSYSIIIANLFTPLIDLYIVPKPYAYRKSAIEKAAGVVKPPLLKRIPKPVIALTIIAALAGVALSGVYSMTKDPIAAAELAKKRESFKVVCENAADFKDVDAAQKALDALEGGTYGGGKFGTTVIEEVYEAVDANGNTAGYVFSITNRNAYNPPLKLALGVDPDGKILKIAFIELNETPGKGSKADEPAFKDQFVGQTDTSAVDTMSGATVTSKAVLNAVNAGLDFFHNVIMEGGK